MTNINEFSRRAHNHVAAQNRKIINANINNTFANRFNQATNYYGNFMVNSHHRINDTLDMLVSNSRSPIPKKVVKIAKRTDWWFEVHGR